MIELDADNFRRGHDAFLRHMQQKGDGVPFAGFGHRFFVTDETAYKEETLAKARKLLEPTRCHEWSKTPGRIVERLKQACDISVSGNLFEHKYGNDNGSYSALYRVDEPDVPEFEAHCVELSRVANSADEIIGPAVDSFAEFLREKRLGCKWEFVAYILFVLCPERFFPIRSTYFDKVLEFYGVSDKIVGRVDKIVGEKAVKIAKEAMLGIEPTETDPESLAFRRQVEQEIAQIKQQGYMPDLPKD